MDGFEIEEQVADDMVLFLAFDVLDDGGNLASADTIGAISDLPFEPGAIFEAPKKLRTGLLFCAEPAGRPAGDPCCDGV